MYINLQHSTLITLSLFTSLIPSAFETGNLVTEGHSACKISNKTIPKDTLKDLGDSA